MRRCVPVIAVLLTIARMGATQEPHRHTLTARSLGSVTFVNSGAAAAQAPFIQGIALLHSFEYDDAAAAFREAQRADTGFALAYWGEALTFSKMLWGLDDVPGARAALARLALTAADRLARAPAGRERGFGAAVEAFYADSDAGRRSLAFADSMRSLTRAYPADPEFAAFGAIAMLMAANTARLPPGRDTLLRNEAIALATKVYRENPRHPGATHYLIHAYDDPALAPRGIEFARAYSRLAPDAEHALHMPSHIFVQVGLWDDVVHANEMAWAASRRAVARSGGPATDNDFHALEWLQYGYLEQGRYSAARALIDTARLVLRGTEPTDPDARFIEAGLRFDYGAATGQWDVAKGLTAPPLPAPGVSPRERAFTRIAIFQAGYAATHTGDTITALGVIATLTRLRDSLGLDDPRGRNIDFLLVQLNGAIALRRGNASEAVRLLQPAAELDNHSSPVGPPWYVPAGEQLGTALLAAGRPREAAAAYQAGMTARPNRSQALAGLSAASKRAGDSKAAAEALRKLLANWHAADPAVRRLALIP